MPDIGARGSWRRPGTGRDGAWSRRPARERDVAAGPVDDRLSGTGASAAVPVIGTSPFNRWVIGVGGIVFAVLMALSDPVRLPPRRAVFPGLRPAPAGQLRRPAGADAAAGLGVAEAVRRVAARAAAVARAGGVGHRRGRRADRPRVRRRPPGAAAGRVRDRHHAGPAGRRPPVRPDRVRPAGLGGAGLRGDPDRAHRRPPLVAARRRWSWAWGWPTSTASACSPSRCSLGALLSGGPPADAELLVPGRRADRGGPSPSRTSGGRPRTGGPRSP